MSRKQNKVILEFIAIYRSEPCLWQVKSTAYHDRAKKDIAYAKLTDKLQELHPNATKKCAIMKINSLRSAYRKEKKKVEESKKSGASADSIYRSSLWYYDLFDFLQDQDPQGTSDSNSESKIDESPEGLGKMELLTCFVDIYNLIERKLGKRFGELSKPFSKLSADKESEEYIKEESVISDVDNTQSTNASVEKLPESQANPPIFSMPVANKRKNANEDLTPTMPDHFKRSRQEHDRYDLIGNTIAFRLRGLNQRLALITEKILNDTLFEAELSQLNSSS